ncbi:DUF3090 family protein [Acidiferrimicrobium sp. IK]|uniref:DUF3090 family protein n=1 Tax=Acidiferrimicrobium sp. IK TaxID=2871700 RepID=UPI0021CB54D0|nr:DUF3090 family protein [Acidiferrimicrobium sp. IK]MCU4185808.1 DUF3090 family protein [Acidiferrimicrobium sp. IK]
MSSSFDLSDPDRVTVGTVGPAGGRTFYLQARQGDRLVTLKLEKQQVGALAELLTELLSDLPDPEEVPATDTLELEEPVLAEWAVGSMQLAFDAGADRIVLIAEEVTVDSPAAAGEEEAISDDPAEADGAIGRLALTRAQAAAIIARGVELVSAGRPPCPFCGYPMDPAGHSCPKTNGHRAPTL